MRRGWFGESQRHYLAAKGISTSVRAKNRKFVTMSERMGFKRFYVDPQTGRILAANTGGSGEINVSPSELQRMNKASRIVEVKSVKPYLAKKGFITPEHTRKGKIEFAKREEAEEQEKPVFTKEGEEGAEWLKSLKEDDLKADETVRDKWKHKKTPAHELYAKKYPRDVEVVVGSEYVEELGHSEPVFEDVVVYNPQEERVLQKVYGERNVDDLGRSEFTMYEPVKWKTKDGQSGEELGKVQSVQTDAGKKDSDRRYKLWTQGKYKGVLWKQIKKEENRLKKLEDSRREMKK